MSDHAPIGESTAVRAWRLRRNWYLPIASLALAIAGYAFSRTSGPDATFGWFGIVIGVPFGALFYARNAFRLAKATELRATRETLTIDGVGEIAATDIVEAKLVPRPSSRGDHLFELVLRDRRRLSFASTLGAAMAMFDMLGINPGERRTTFTTVVPFGKRFLAVFAVLGLPWTVLSALENADVVLVLLSLFFWVVPMCALVAMFVGLLRGKLVVGAEGFTRRWLFWQRFTSFADVASIESVKPFLSRDRVDVIVTFDGGTRSRIRAAEAPDTAEQRGAESRALFRHLLQAHARATEIGSPIGAAPLLRRGPRTVREWLASLEQIAGTGGSGYRVATMSPEALGAIVRSVDTPIDARVGAAVALVRVGQTEHHATIRVAAEASAEPSTRALLEGLLEARTDEELERVLERVRGESQR